MYMVSWHDGKQLVHSFIRSAGETIAWYILVAGKSKNWPVMVFFNNELVHTEGE